MALSRDSSMTSSLCDAVLSDVCRVQCTHVSVVRHWAAGSLHNSVLASVCESGPELCTW